MFAYYNEIDPYAAQWLRNLMNAGHIAPGLVDERSIENVTPDDLAPFTQCHFFAGIGVWSHALRRAGWNDDRPIWTGSCPCQPFSAAGRRNGFDDERHLWPAFHYLIEQCRPPVVMGEQVASKDGLTWFDLVSADLEGTGYAVGANDMCVAGVGGPHIRQRLWFGAVRVEGLDYTAGARHERQVEITEGDSRDETRLRLSGSGSRSDRLADTNDARSQGWGGMSERADQRPVGSVGMVGGLADTSVCGRQHESCVEPTRVFSKAIGNTITGAKPCRHSASSVERPGPTNGFWRDADWLLCRDGRWRSVEPGTFPLAYGPPSRVGRLRAYGNAINAEEAEIEIAAFMDVLDSLRP